MAPEIKLNGQPLTGIIPEQSGVYPTTRGEVGVELKTLERGRIQVVLDCTKASDLQGWQRKTVRMIDLGYKGVGSQQISQTEHIQYDLGRPVQRVGSKPDLRRRKERRPELVRY